MNLGLGILLIKQKGRVDSWHGVRMFTTGPVLLCRTNLCCKNSWTKFLGCQRYSSISIKKQFLKRLALNLRFQNALEICRVCSPTFVYFPLNKKLLTWAGYFDMMTPLRVLIHVHANQSTPNILKTYPINIWKLMNAHLLTPGGLWKRRIHFCSGLFSGMWI